jgi:hypothetical protein
MPRRGRSLPEAVVEPALGLAAVQDTVKGVGSCWIRGEQVGEDELWRGGACSEAETSFGRDLVSFRGPDHALLYARPI